MIDYFALLGVERRPAITEEILKEAYFRKSESLQSDSAESGELSAVNAAFRTIANPAMRIQHLLKLEFGDPGGGKIGADLGELFGLIVIVLQNADQELASLSAQSSPILRALAYRKLDGLRQQLEQVERELSQRESGLLAEVARLDQSWLEDTAHARPPMAQIALDLTFVQKWLSQVRERKIRLEELA
jgi:tetrahydromethanopterin S-methyltransferase subunit G